MTKTTQALFNWMKAGATVITPNNRLSNQLLHDYFLNQDVIIEDKPLCLPYQAFLTVLYDKARRMYPHSTHPVLLSHFQQHCLWRQIITKQEQYPCNDGLLHEIQDAWTRCQQWQLDMQDPLFSFTPQTRQFQQWQQQYQDALTHLNAITQEQLLPQLLHYPNIINATTIVWVCFDDFTPQQRRLQQQFDAHGCQQIYYDIPPCPSTTKRYAALDTQDEWLQLVNWLRSRMAAGDERIGVVVPDLQTQHHALQRFLQQHIPTDQFNISLGKPLTDYPLVTHALMFLNLNKNIISNHQARLLLHSPFLLGAKSELEMRSHTIQKSALLQETEILTETLVQAFSKTAPKLATLMANLTNYPKTASAKTWINAFKTRLLALGFPGEYSLNSSTYQCFQRFMSLFDELLTLSSIHPLMDAQMALRALQELAQSTIFQTRKATTRIRILGLLEASGCTFDSVWVLGLTDQCLPQKTQLSAFIPLELQRNHQMPRAIASRELQFAQQLLQRLQYGSQHSVFSYPCLSGDMPNMPSPLIIHLPMLHLTALPPTSNINKLVPYEDNYILPLYNGEKASGGTSLLADQAKCPFRAFAAHRLHATSAPTLSTGPNASERGQILHRIMELLWQQISSQQHLNSLSETTLNQLIDTAIQQAIAPVIKTRQQSFSSLVQDVESQRLRLLVRACLDWEKRRPPFVVESLEQTYIMRLSDIDFRVRIDRMDRVDSDKKWVIDYKTSLPAVKPWNEERPEAPQLLLYALLDNSINALLFVQLKAGRLLCSGLSEEALSIKGVNGLKKNERWSDYQQQWHQQLNALATEFKQGICSPKPSKESTCMQCDFQSLCRIS